MDTRNDLSTTSTTPPVVAYHDSATKLAVAPKGPHLIVRYDETGEAASVLWHTAYGDPAFESLRLMARSRQGKWTGDGWTFPSSEQLRRFLAASRAIRSGWPQIDQHPYSPRLRVTEFADSHLLLWAPVSEIAKSTHGKNAFNEVEKIAATDKWSFKTVVLGVRRAFFLLMIVGPAVDSRADRLAKIKARIGTTDEALPWLTERPVRLACKGWMLSMEFDVRDPRHLLVMASFVRAPDRRGTLSDHELEPVITVDRSIWPKAAKLLGDHGIALIGDAEEHLCRTKVAALFKTAKNDPKINSAFGEDIE